MSDITAAFSLFTLKSKNGTAFLESDVFLVIKAAGGPARFTDS